jgi:hypothetical protein
MKRKRRTRGVSECCRRAGAGVFTHAMERARRAGKRQTWHGHGPVDMGGLRVSASPTSASLVGASWLPAHATECARSVRLACSSLRRCCHGHPHTICPRTLRREGLLLNQLFILSLQFMQLRLEAHGISRHCALTARRCGGSLHPTRGWTSTCGACGLLGVVS